MLDGNGYITKSEHRVYFALIFAGLVLRIIEMLPAFLVIDTQGSQGFTMYDPIPPKLISPGYCFIVFFIGSILAWKITPLSLTLSIVLVLLLAYFFDYWFVDTRRMVAMAAETNPEHQFKTFDFALLGGSVYDLVSLCLVNLLVIVQISILVIWKQRRLP